MLITNTDLESELPYSIEIHKDGNIVYGNGKTPSGAIMAALSVGRLIPSGTRDRVKAVNYILTNYPPKREWIKIMRMIAYDTFTVFMD